jgi:hypothetical protein
MILKCNIMKPLALLLFGLTMMPLSSGLQFRGSDLQQSGSVNERNLGKGEGKGGKGKGGKVSRPECQSL